MAQRIVEVVLVLMIVIGAALLWRSANVRSELTAEYDRLVRKTGQLPIGDETKVHIRALEIDEPGHYAWRAYFPPNYAFSYATGMGGGSSSRSSAWEGILRVRIRNTDKGFMVYTRLVGGSSLRGYGSGKLRDLFHRRPGLLQELQVNQLGADELTVFDATEAQTLLEVALPEKLLAEIKEQVTLNEYNEITPFIERIRIGPTGFEERERAAAATGQAPQ